MTYLGAASGYVGDAVGGLVVGNQYTVQPVSGNTINLVHPDDQRRGHAHFGG